MRSIIIIVIALLIGILATLITLNVMGNGSIFGGGSNADDLDLKDKTIVIMSARDIPAYTAVSLEDVTDPRTGAKQLRAISNDNLPDPAAITYAEFATKINGRVLRETKRANRYFTESDFMPEGTAAGLAGATPPGKRGIIVQADEIVGAYGLQEGDRFDLLMTIPASSVRSESVSGNSLLGGSAAQTASFLPGTTVVLVNGGYVVTPVTTRLESVDVPSGILGSQTTTQTRPIKELAIAIDPDEVVNLTSALSAGRNLVAVVRSGQLGAEGNETNIPMPNISLATDKEEKPVAEPVKAIEVIVGNERSSFIYQDAN